MASSGDGVGHLSSTSLVFGEGTSIPSRNGRDKKGLWIPQAVKEEIIGNSRIIAEPGWDSITSPLWVCNTAKKYVKMHHIDKLFPKAIWKYNHRVSGVKPGESKSKHFAHCALEVWFALYPDKSFGPNNKNIISYSMVAMVYVEIELKRKVDWQTVFTRNKEDRTEYGKADVPDNFNFFLQNIRVRPTLDACGANRNTSRSTRTIRDEDSVGKAICFAKSGSRSKDEEGASASRKLDSTLPRLEGDIQDAGSVGGPNLNLIELQRDLVILTSKYELLQHDACHSRKGHQKLERERGVWILEKARMKEEFKVLKSSEVRIQGLHGDEQKKCAALAQQLADISAQLTSREEALKEVQNEFQLQKEWSDMFMSFVDGETNKVDIRKLLRELEHLQERINERDVDRVVDSVLNDVLDNDVSELEPCTSGREGNHPRWFGEMVGGGRYDNLLDLDSLSLPNFPMQDYMPICEVVQPEPALKVPHSKTYLQQF
jgi:hypothetical protein